MENQSEKPKEPPKPRRAKYDPEEDQPMTHISDEDVEEWTERERKRREAWLAGPTEEEKLAWARHQRARREALSGETPTTIPTDEEVEEWAERERKRREAWLAGPTEEEKLAWARDQRLRRETAFDFESLDFELDPIIARRRREAILAREGMLYLLFERPWALLSKWIRAGRRWEEEAFRPTRSSRIRFPDDD